MKKIFYLWILPTLAWVFFLSIIISTTVFELVTPDYVSDAVGYTFVACVVVLFFLTIIFAVWYAMTTGGLKDTKKIIEIWMNKYFESEKIESKIQCELNFDFKSVDTTISFDGKQLKFYTEIIGIRQHNGPKFSWNKGKKYEMNIEKISLESKQALMSEIKLLTDKKTTLYLYKDDVEIKSQPMPRRFPFIYLNFNEFRTEMNTFLDRPNVQIESEWHNPLVDEKL